MRQQWTGCGTALVTPLTSSGALDEVAVRRLARRQIDACGLPCAGWVANCVEPDMLQLEANIRALELRLACPLIGIVPFRPDMIPAVAAALLSLDAIAGIRA